MLVKLAPAAVIGVSVAYAVANLWEYAGDALSAALTAAGLR